MKFTNKITVVTSSILLFGTSFATTDSPNMNMSKNMDMSSMSNEPENNSLSSIIAAPFVNTFNALTNKDKTWGTEMNHQDNMKMSSPWYIGLMAGGMINLPGQSDMGGPQAMFMLQPGYQINKYVGVQYNQMFGLTGGFTGIGEGTITIPTGTMVSPVFVGGAGWTNISGKVTGAWDVGGGLSFMLSSHVMLMASYRYVKAIGAQNSSMGGMQMGGGMKMNAMQMVGGGLMYSL
jgi:opacity protein-like surface antigen